LTRLLSGKLQDLTGVLPLQRAVYFPEDKNLSPWVDTTALKRYNLTFPFYPFRTLAPRDMHLFRQSGGRFEPSSPLFPAHTQINLTFKRRDKKNLLDFMVPEKLDPLKGSKNGTMSATERNDSLEFGGSGLNPPRLHNVLSVNVKLNDAYLVVGRFFLFFDGYSLELLIFTRALAQVLRIRYRGISPERPLSNVFTAYRSIFTPVQKVSLSTYDLAWESQGRPQVVYISFIKYVSPGEALPFRAPAPDAAAGSGRRLRTPPDAGSGRRRAVSRAGVTRPRPGRFRINDRHVHISSRHISYLFSALLQRIRHPAQH
jgi:hypothetical protein